MLAALYVVVIAAYALLLPAWASVLVAAAAGASYVGAQLLTGAQNFRPGLWGQLVVFGFVFVLVALLGERLQRQVTAQRAMAIRAEPGPASRRGRSSGASRPASSRWMPPGPSPSPTRPPSGCWRSTMQADGGAARSWTGSPGCPPELHDAVVAGIRRGERVGRGEGTVHAPGRPAVPDRPQHHHVRAGRGRRAGGDRDLHRPVRAQAAPGAAPPGRAARGRGGAVAPRWRTRSGTRSPRSGVRWSSWPPRPAPTRTSSSSGA